MQGIWSRFCRLNLLVQHLPWGFIETKIWKICGQVNTVKSSSYSWNYSLLLQSGRRHCPAERCHWYHKDCSDLHWCSNWWYWQSTFYGNKTQCFCVELYPIYFIASNINLLFPKSASWHINKIMIYSAILFRKKLIPIKNRWSSCIDTLNDGQFGAWIYIYIYIYIYVCVCM